MALHILILMSEFEHVEQPDPPQEFTDCISLSPLPGTARSEGSPAKPALP
uniref:Uncharacterized protein n=1 Tax=Rhizophora mucronata TaxID=61149 RepID=A0A2P2MJ70_RHIMU